MYLHLPRRAAQIRAHGLSFWPMQTPSPLNVAGTLMSQTEALKVEQQRRHWKRNPPRRAADGVRILTAAGGGATAGSGKQAGGILARGHAGPRRRPRRVRLGPRSGIPGCARPAPGERRPRPQHGLHPPPRAHRALPLLALGPPRPRLRASLLPLLRSNPKAEIPSQTFLYSLHVDKRSRFV